MTDNELTLEERVERYLSVEWSVTAEAAISVTRFAKLLHGALAEVTQSMDEAHKAGDVHALSTGLTQLLMILSSCQAKVYQTESDSFAHYVELLGSREAISEMAEAMDAYFDERPERERDSFDALLARFDGGKMV